MSRHTPNEKLRKKIWRSANPEYNRALAKVYYFQGKKKRLEAELTALLALLAPPEALLDNRKNALLALLEKTKALLEKAEALLEKQRGATRSATRSATSATRETAESATSATRHDPPTEAELYAEIEEYLTPDQKRRLQSAKPQRPQPETEKFIRACDIGMKDTPERRAYAREQVAMRREAIERAKREHNHANLQMHTDALAVFTRRFGTGE